MSYFSILILLFIALLFLLVLNKIIIILKNEQREAIQITANTLPSSEKLDDKNNYKELKGLQFELLIKNCLNATMDTYFKVLHDINIEVNGKKTQIDVILLTYAGIYVIESKNWEGSIYGKYNDYKWTQVLKNGEKNYYFNPIKQNKYHIQILSEYLKLPLNKFYSYIIFSNDTKINEYIYKYQRIKLLKYEHMLKQIRYDLKNNAIRLTYEQIDKIYYLLKY